MKKYVLLAALACALPGVAHAAPGLADEVYGATVSKGEFEFEARYGVLTGGPEGGEDKLKLEAGYGVTRNLRLALVGEFEKEAGGSRKAEAMSIEAIYALGNAGGIDFALYGEYEIVLDGTDAIEAKLLMQYRTGPWDLRLNLIAEKPLFDGAKVELGYAASVDYAIGEVSLGFQAYGELGTFSDFAPRAEHFLGPVAKAEIEGLGPEIGIELGYLFALGAAKDETDGQVRVKLEVEF